MEYQLHSLVKTEIGIIGKMQAIDKENEKYILVDISKGGCRLEAVSQSFFEVLFSKYFQSPR
jgi:hypothetical protein